MGPVLFILFSPLLAGVPVVFDTDAEFLNAITIMNAISVNKSRPEFNFFILFILRVINIKFPIVVCRLSDRIKNFLHGQYIKINCTVKVQYRQDKSKFLTC